MALPIVITMVTIKNVAMVSMFTAATVSFITGAVQDVKRTKLEKDMLQEKLNANIRWVVEDQLRIYLKQRDAQIDTLLKEEEIVIRAHIRALVLDELSKVVGNKKPTEDNPVIITG